MTDKSELDLCQLQEALGKTRAVADYALMHLASMVEQHCFLKEIDGVAIYCDIGLSANEDAMDLLKQVGLLHPYPLRPEKDWWVFDVEKLKAVGDKYAQPRA